MKTIKRLLLSAVLTFACAQMANAHALWFEANTLGVKGADHVVKIYYGEYATKEIEKTDAWYSDLKSISVFVIHPDGNKTKLELQDKGTFMEAHFLPKSDGLYIIEGIHPSKDLGGTTLYEFGSQLAIQVGKSAAATQGGSQYTLRAVPGTFKKSAKVQLQLLEKGQPIAGQDITIMTPAGWSKTYKTDASGKVFAEALWAGTYVAEWGHSATKTGVWNGKDYTATWLGLTTSFLVK